MLRLVCQLHLYCFLSPNHPSFPFDPPAKEITLKGTPLSTLFPGQCWAPSGWGTGGTLQEEGLLTVFLETMLLVTGVGDRGQPVMLSPRRVHRRECMVSSWKHRSGLTADNLPTGPCPQRCPDSFCMLDCLLLGYGSLSPEDAFLFVRWLCTICSLEDPVMVSVPQWWVVLQWALNRALGREPTFHVGSSLITLSQQEVSVRGLSTSSSFFLP